MQKPIEEKTKTAHQYANGQRRKKGEARGTETMRIFVIVTETLLKFAVKTRCVKTIRRKKVENKREGENILGKYQKEKKKLKL